MNKNISRQVSTIPNKTDRDDVFKYIKFIITASGLDAEEYKVNQLIKLYFTRFTQKAEEMTGTKLTLDGIQKIPNWSRRNTDDLKSMVRHSGRKTIEAMIELFFSDEVYGVAQFTRYKQSAGYEFQIFKSQAPKLVMIPHHGFVPCTECGKRRTHTSTCSVQKKIMEEKETARQKALKIRADNQQLSLKSMFVKIIRRS